MMRQHICCIQASNTEFKDEEVWQVFLGLHKLSITILLPDFLIPLFFKIVLVVLDKYLFASINLKKDDV